MIYKNVKFLEMVIICSAFLFCASLANADEVERPEEIKSKRQVIYSQETYANLAEKWQSYFEVYPSEYAYANWMYAARYAGDKDYSELLNRGYEKYPANPTLLYLKSMERHGSHHNTEALKYLERAIDYDPGYYDAWFSLAMHYMDFRDDEKFKLALRKILESGSINDEVMDYCYNMIIGLKQNAIIITNGDNDTYPVWVLTELLDIRPDVDIVNRNLLNTDWYPLYVIEKGLPSFINQKSLEKLRSDILEQIKSKEKIMPMHGPFCDTLIIRLIDTAENAGRPVYFSNTLYVTDILKSRSENGYPLGLVTLVSKPSQSYSKYLVKSYEHWLNDFRTGGLESWRLGNAPETDAGRHLVINYAYGLACCLDSLKKADTDLCLNLFRWYNKYIEINLKENIRNELVENWCELSDIPEISKWCKAEGIKK